MEKLELKKPHSAVNVISKFDDVVNLCKIAAKNKTRVLITGETGSGKSFLLAKLAKIFKGTVDLDKFGAWVKVDNAKLWFVTAEPGYFIYSGTGDNIYSVIQDMKPGLIIYVYPDLELLRRASAAKALTAGNGAPHEAIVHWTKTAKLSPAKYKRWIMANISHLMDFLVGKRILDQDGILQKTDSIGRTDGKTFLAVYKQPVENLKFLQGWHGDPVKANPTMLETLLPKANPLGVSNVSGKG